LLGHVLQQRADRSGWNESNPIDHVHAVHHFPENSIAGLVVVVVQRYVVRQVDEELGGGGIGIRRARHGQRAAFILQAIAGLVLDGWTPARGFFIVLGIAASLDDETGNDTMKDSAIVEVFLDIFEEIGNRLRRLVFEHLYGYIAVIGMQYDHGVGVLAG